MAKVSISTPEKAARCDPPEGLAGAAEMRAMFDRESDPIHLHLHRIARGDALRIGPGATDCVGYVWRGSIAAGARSLATGSSLIVERGATLTVHGGDEGASVLTFAASQPPAEPRAGGHVHLLPREHVPRLAHLTGDSGVGGGIHANASCPTCSVWLHENDFPGTPEVGSAEAARAGVHCHSEDEIIFVTDGQIRLGARLFGPGTAIAIAADTLYSFTPGPEGLRFINFRPGLPSEIRFPNGRSMDEVAYWKTRMPEPRYLSVDQ